MTDQSMISFSTGAKSIMSIEGDAHAVNRMVRELCMVVRECEEVVNVLSKSCFRKIHCIKIIKM